MLMPADKYTIMKKMTTSISNIVNVKLISLNKIIIYLFIDEDLELLIQI